LTSALDGGQWSALRSGRLTARYPGTHWIGGWVDTKAPNINIFMMVVNNFVPEEKILSEL